MIRVALCQIDPTVGDLDGNVALITAWAARATEAGADLAVFPELAIPGYPPEDLVLRPGFVSDQLAALDALAAATAQGCAVIAGFVDRSGRGLHNAAAMLRDGAVAARYHKCRLPNYGVFDEERYFEAADEGITVDVAETTIGLSVCEDAWFPGAPWTDYTDLPLIVNINGSPFHRGKVHEREDVLAARALETGAWIVYVNAVGGQDELVFDGGSLVMTPDGTVAARATRFEEDLLVVDLDLEAGTVQTEPRPPWPEGPAEVYRAVVLGTRDYVRKNGFSEVVLGLSGGVDSALVAAIAADAVGPEAVRALAMPSMYSSPESLEDASEVATRLGIRLDVVSITGVFEAYAAALGPLGVVEGLAAENLQARIRGNDLMAVSNRFGPMVLATGNKSEYAVGYSTLYGDMAGGFAPIKDVPKTLVYELCAWLNAAIEAGTVPPIPERVMTKPPSAELRPDQKDTDSLPPYDVLDPIIEAYVEEDLDVDAIAEREIGERGTAARVASMIDRAEYKRRQAAPGVKITPKAFGRDRRLPITNLYEG
ncbi:MAG: NAD+ synthase [Actinomycetota bacterium]